VRVPEFAQPGWLALLVLAPVLVALQLRARPLEGRFKRVAGSLLRCIALGALVVALAGPLKSSYSRHTDLVFALDVSSSIDRETAAEALRFVNRALAAKDPAARVGLVVFGADAAVETLLRRAAQPVAEISSLVRRGGTDIGRALEVAVGAFPSGGHRRVVLLSDGRENLGRARSAAAMARSIGVEIYAIPLERAALRDEVYVQDMSAPPRVRVHEPFEVQMTVHSNKAALAHLVIMRNGRIVHDSDLSLQPGSNVFPLVEQVSVAGLYEYEAVVNAEVDGVVENNRYQAFVEVRGAPKVLHAIGEPGSESYVTAALRAQGLSVEEVPASALPATTHKLVDYDVVILNNVSGFDLSVAKMELLEEYVRDAGGGLISLGGDRSYSAGGYHGTPVERLLPVSMDVKTEVRIPALAVVIVIDKSGSMSAGSPGEGKIAIAKSAALSAIEVLSPLDQVGVLAFDAEHEWTVPPTAVGDRRAIVEKLRSLGAGGGTDLFLALQEARRAMGQLEARVKHVIVLSDGLTDSAADLEGLARRFAEDGITVSTVAFGADADRGLMARIADGGRGRFYHTEDPLNVPRIFTSETMVVSRDLVVEGETYPTLVYPGEMIEGFGPGSFPPVAGYLRTFAKPAAQVLLSAREEDPLLVSWRYGLGKSVAFTSDLAGKWGRRWVGWHEFGRFVAQMARWAMRRSGAETLLPTFRWEGRRGEMLVDVLDRDDRFINGLQMRATVVDPDRSTSRIALEQVAPGRYRGEFDVPSAGRYYVNLAGSAGDLRVGPKTFGLAVLYSSEYLGLGVDREHLADLAAMTGGQVLSLSNASLAALAAVTPQAIDQRWRVWWPLLLTALGALVLEVAVRKVTLPQSWWLRWLRLRDRRRQAAEAEPEYQELLAGITRVREQYLEALRSGTFHGPVSADDPAVRARLYVPGSKRTRG
jgi:Mg-chelatase subunit ChlD